MKFDKVSDFSRGLLFDLLTDAYSFDHITMSDAIVPIGVVVMIFSSTIYKLQNNVVLSQR